MSLNRFQWLTCEVHKGRSVFVTFSYNAKSRKEKIKFVLEDDYSVRTVYRPCVMAALSAVHAALLNCIVTDKGHRSTNGGNTIIEYWLQQPADHAVTKAAGKGLGQPLDPASSFEEDFCEEAASTSEVGVPPVSTAVLEEIEATGPPPNKRVRFDIGNEVVFCSEDRLTPMTLEDFIADIHPPAPAVADAALDNPYRKVIEAYTCMHQNAMALRNVVSDSQPVLPYSEHQLLIARCAYLLALFPAQPGDMKNDEWQDKFDAIAEIYVGIRADFEGCLEQAGATPNPE